MDSSSLGRVAIRSQADIRRTNGRGDCRAVEGRTGGRFDRRHEDISSGYFDNQPIAARARAELIEKLKKSGRPLEVEMALWQSQPGSSPCDRRSGAGRGGRILSSSRYEPRRRRRVIAGCFRDSAIRSAATAKPAANSWKRFPRTIRCAKPSSTADQWPTGRVDATVDSTRNNNNRISYGRFPLEFRGNRGPYFEDLNLVYDQNRMMILCSDALGNEIWQFPLNDENRSQNQMYSYQPRRNSRSGMGARACCCPSGGRLLAIDTLAADRTHPPKILWTEDGGDDASRISRRTANPHD